MLTCMWSPWKQIGKRQQVTFFLSYRSSRDAADLHLGPDNSLRHTITDKKTVHMVIITSKVLLVHIKYWLTALRFYVPLNTKKVISETFPKPTSWLGMEKQNLTQQRHAFTNQNKYVWDWRSTPLEWLSITGDLDLGSGHTAYGRASVIDLYRHTKFHWNRKNFFVDGLTTGTALSSRSHDTKTRINIENAAGPNLDIVL